MNPAQKAGQTTQDIARSIAKQIAREPVEILKDAGSQVSGIEKVAQRESLQIQNSKVSADSGIQISQEKLKDEAVSSRRMQALQNEINDIRKQDVFKDLQGKISSGEYVSLQDYSELSMEQKQVLKAQMEAYRNEKIKMESQNFQEVPAIQSKPSRRFGAGQKQEAEKAQTRVEKPIPPSG